ncbi:MAG: hypothetical protein BGO97_12265 [Micrococcales bacterium 70-64]|nr:MAG: hypothetical protein ABT06_12265 [Leifsonia sp. SCN 70-46]OJX86424.1 MAG: hypothetical protein BGO97_12265 [Micrococcales bacterium 70-64]
MTSIAPVQLAVAVLVVVGAVVVLAARYRTARRTGVGVKGARDRLLLAGVAGGAVAVGAVIAHNPLA